MAKEYIERDSLAGKLIGMKCCSTLSKFDFGDVLRLINSEPTADVQEVRHGKWIKSKHIKFGNEFKCPFCDYSYFTDDMEYNFCPNCGAKMDAGMTNFEKIKQMSVEELAEYILDEFRIDCAQCECRFDYNGCRYCIKHHFESEAEE